MNRITLFALSLLAVACMEGDEFDTGAEELEASMEVHEPDLDVSKGSGSSYQLGTVGYSKGSGGLIGAAGNDCRGPKGVSDACCQLAKDVLDGDTTSETCKELAAECPPIGFPSHNPKVYDAQLLCIGWDNALQSGLSATP